jgi:hypothetical protein
MNPERAARRLILLSVLGLLAGIGLSWPLWNAYLRPSLPAVPAFDFLEKIGHLGHLSWLLIFLGAFTVVFYRRKSLLYVWLICLLALVLSDINRLQPWVLTYALILLSLAGGNVIAGINASRWVVAGIYFWGGLFKFSPYFATDTFKWFCSAFEFSTPWGQHALLGYLVALFEMLLGLSLLWYAQKRWLAWVAILFHGSIVLALSPLGHHWNTVVIPWNIAMAGFVWILCTIQEKTSIPKTYQTQLIVLIACGLPAFNLIGYWPNSLSWKMYSNTQPEASFYTPKGAPCIPIKACWEQQSYDLGTKMLLDDWGQTETYTPLLSDKRVFEYLGRYLCNCATRADSSGIIVLSVDPWNSKNEQIKKIPCQQLLKK